MEVYQPSGLFRSEFLLKTPRLIFFFVTHFLVGLYYSIVAKGLGIVPHIAGMN